MNRSNRNLIIQRVWIRYGKHIHKAIHLRRAYYRKLRANKGVVDEGVKKALNRYKEAKEWLRTYKIFAHGQELPDCPICGKRPILTVDRPEHYLYECPDHPGAANHGTSYTEDGAFSSFCVYARVYNKKKAEHLKDLQELSTKSVLYHILYDYRRWKVDNCNVRYGLSIEDSGVVKGINMDLTSRVKPNIQVNLFVSFNDIRDSNGFSYGYSVKIEGVPVGSNKREVLDQATYDNELPAVSKLIDAAHMFWKHACRDQHLYECIAAQERLDEVEKSNTSSNSRAIGIMQTLNHQV